MFKSDSTASGLREFIERFKKRLMEMAFKEKESTVRTPAISVLVQAADNGFLDSEDMKELACLVYSEDPKIRTLAKPIAKEIWSDDYYKPLLDVVRDNDDASEVHAAIKAFAQFVIQTTDLVNDKSGRDESESGSPATSGVDQWLSNAAKDLSTNAYDRVKAAMDVLVDHSNPLEVLFSWALYLVTETQDFDALASHILGDVDSEFELDEDEKEIIVCLFSALASRISADDDVDESDSYKLCQDLLKQVPKLIEVATSGEMIHLIRALSSINVELLSDSRISQV